MKKVILIITAFLFFSAGKIFAQSDKTSNAFIQASFAEHFKNAKQVSWKETINFTEVVFTADNKQLSLFYNTDKRPFAMSRNITTEQLPVALLLDLKSKYAAYWITDLMEVAIDGQSVYYLTVQNADEQKTMKSDASGQWVAYQLADNSGL